MDTVKCPDTGKVQEYRHIMIGPENPKCVKFMSNELGCLFQRIRGINGTDTCSLSTGIFSQECKVTYCHIFCNIGTQKKETNQVWITVGGANLTYYGPVSNLISNITASKLH